MLLSRVCLSLGIATFLTPLASPAGAGQDGSTVVAEVGDHKIVLSELEQKEAGALLQARNKYYLARNSH